MGFEVKGIVTLLNIYFGYDVCSRAAAVLRRGRDDR